MSEPIPSDLHISVCLKVDNDNGSMTCMPVVLAMKQHPEETHKALIAAIREISSSPDSPKAFSLDLLDELLVHLDKDHHIPHHVLNKARYTMETYRDNARIVRQAAAANKKRKANNSATDFKFVNMGVRSSIPKPPPKPQTGQQKPWQASKYQEQVPSPVESTYRSLYSEPQQSASPASGPDQGDHLRYDQFARRDSYRSLYPETQQSTSPGSATDQNSQRPPGESYNMMFSTSQQSRSPASAPEQNDHFRHDPLARRDSYRSVYAETRQSVSPLSATEQNSQPRPDQFTQPPRYQGPGPAVTEPYRTVYPKPQPPILASSASEQTNDSRSEQPARAPNYQEQPPPNDPYKPIRSMLPSSSSPVPVPDQNNSQPDQVSQISRFHLNPFKNNQQESQQSTSPASTPGQNDRALPEQLARAALSMSQEIPSPSNNSQQSESRSPKIVSDSFRLGPPPPPPPPHTPTSQTFKFSPSSLPNPPPLPPPPASLPQLPPQTQTHSQSLPNVNSILNSTASEIKTLPPYLSIYGPSPPPQRPPTASSGEAGPTGDAAKQKEGAES